MGFDDYLQSSPHFSPLADMPLRIWSQLVPTKLYWSLILCDNLNAFQSFGFPKEPLKSRSNLRTFYVMGSQKNLKLESLFFLHRAVNVYIGIR